MFPGLGKINPKQMQAMMRQMGINQEDLDVNKVIIEKSDGSKIIVEPASVQKITMQGQTSFQVAGDTREEPVEAFSQEDIELVAEKTSCSLEEARSALEKTGGDIAEAIMKLKK